MKNHSRTDALYWMTILSACTMGETAADFLSHGPMQFGYAKASLILGSLVLIALLAERFANAANQTRYWTTIVIMATAGTTIADYLSRTMAMGYFWSSVVLFTIFLTTLLLGGKRNTQIESLTHQTELLPQIEIDNPIHALPETDARYWASIMVASTLGTTFGDYFADSVELGFGASTAILGVLLLIVLFVEYRAEVRNEARYWSALIICSTIGATSGDFLTKEDGLGLGYYWGNAFLVGVFVIIGLIGRRRLIAKNLNATAAMEDANLLPHVEIP